MSKTWDQDYDRDHNRDYNRDNRDYNRDNKFTRFFDDFLSDAKAHVGSRLRSAGDGGGRRQPTWIPTIDVTENEREYTVVVDVPGVRKEDIDIEFNDSVLAISGHHRRDPTTTAAQNVNVKHDRDHRQLPDSTNYQPSQYPQSNQYKQQPPTDYQQQPQTDHQQQQQPTEYQQQQQPTQYQQQQQPTEYQQQQKPTEYQQQKPTEYQQQQQQQPPIEYPQQQQQTDYQSSQKPPPTDYQQSSNQQSNQQPTELHRVKKSHPKDNRDGEYEKIHIQERHYGYFSRSIQLPSNIKKDVEFLAKLENGVLRIQVPKNSERPRRKITIL